MKVKEVFEKSVQFLRERKIDSPRLEAELLIASVLKTDRIGIYLKYEAPLQDEEVTRLRELIVRKGKGEPTAYLLNEKYFFGRRFQVGPGVLIPRPETEQIVEDVLKTIQSGEAFEEISIADLGAGSGCLGLTLGLEISAAKVDLVERSPQARFYCETNLNKLIPEEQRHRFQIHEHDVCDWHPTKQFEIIVANPPYIDSADPDVAPDVRAFEPHEALFADEQGLGAIKAWLVVVENYLKAGGFCYFEIGQSQGEIVRNLFVTTNKFKSVEILQDFNKKDRIIKAVRNG